MLVLSRKINESIIIGDNIKLIVVDINGGRVRIGIEAPHDVNISRPEAKNQTKDRPDDSSAKLKEHMHGIGHST